MPSRRRVLEAVDMDYWLIGDGGGAVSNGGWPNVLVIWGDDIGISNLGCCFDGVKAASFTIDQAVAKLEAALTTGQ
jgi:hypothetical protein